MENLGDKIYFSFMEVKSRFLRPVARILAFLRVTPNLISHSSILLMIVFPLVIGYSESFALLILAIVLMFDGIDGVLARHLKIESDKGKFTDIISDVSVFTLFVGGLVAADLLNGLTGLLYVYLTLMARLFCTIRRNILKPSDWIIHPEGDFSLLATAGISYIAFAIYVFWKINYFDIMFIIFSGLLAIKAAIDYWSLKNDN